MVKEKDPKHRRPFGRGGCRERRDRQNRGGEKQGELTVRNEEDESDDRIAFADRELQVNSHARKASTAERKAGQLEESERLRGNKKRHRTTCSSRGQESGHTLIYWFIYETNAVECSENGDEAQVDLAQGALRKGQFILTSPPSGLLL
jgi:hypothetical protein